MRTSSGLVDNKVLSKFSLKTNDGSVLMFRIMVLPVNRYEEFIGLFMKYFVPYERTHIVTGILDSTDALNEYRQGLREYFKNESLHKFICCLDSDGTASEIFGGSVLKLYRKGDPCDDIVQVQTEPMRRWKNIEKELDNLVPIDSLMMKYNVDQYYEFMWTFVRPDMRHMGILKEMAEGSIRMCQMHGVPLIGAWCTSKASQKVCDSLGWKLIREISYKDLGQLSDVNIEDDMFTIKFMLHRRIKRSNL